MTPWLAAAASLVIGGLAAAVGVLWNRAARVRAEGRARELELLLTSIRSELATAYERLEAAERAGRDAAQRNDKALADARADLQAEVRKHVAFVRLLEMRFGKDERFAQALREFARTHDRLRPPDAGAGAEDPALSGLGSGRDKLLPFDPPPRGGGSGGDGTR